MEAAFVNRRGLRQTHGWERVMNNKRWDISLVDLMHFCTLDVYACATDSGSIHRRRRTVANAVGAHSLTVSSWSLAQEQGDSAQAATFYNMVWYNIVLKPVCQKFWGHAISALWAALTKIGNCNTDSEETISYKRWEFRLTSHFFSGNSCQEHNRDLSDLHLMEQMCLNCNQ